MTTEEQAYREGFEASRAGKTSGDNPYGPEGLRNGKFSPEFWAWVDGFTAGEDASQEPDSEPDFSRGVGPDRYPRA